MFLSFIFDLPLLVRQHTSVPIFPVAPMTALNIVDASASLG